MPRVHEPPLLSIGEFATATQLTAKALREDRQKCIEAGASDYLAKPVSSEQLLSILRVWLFRKQDQNTEGTPARPEVVSG